MDLLPDELLDHVGSFLRVSSCIRLSRWTRDTWSRRARAEKWRHRQQKINVPLRLAERTRRLSECCCTLCGQEVPVVIDLTEEENGERVFSRGPFCAAHTSTCAGGTHYFERYMPPHM